MHIILFFMVGSIHRIHLSISSTNFLNRVCLIFCVRVTGSPPCISNGHFDFDGDDTKCYDNRGWSRHGLNNIFCTLARSSRRQAGPTRAHHIFERWGPNPLFCSNLRHSQHNTRVRGMRQYFPKLEKSGS